MSADDKWMPTSECPVATSATRHIHMIGTQKCAACVALNDIREYWEKQYGAATADFEKLGKVAARTQDTLDQAKRETAVKVAQSCTAYADAMDDAIMEVQSLDLEGRDPCCCATMEEAVEAISARKGGTHDGR